MTSFEGACARQWTAWVPTCATQARHVPGVRRRLERDAEAERAGARGRAVTRWKGGSAILRWTAAGVLEAERHFRNFAGYRTLPRLIASLHQRDSSIDPARGVDNRKQAA